jgi:hypothetical protein
MHRGGFVRGLLVAILLLALVGGAAYYAYGAGVAQGLLDSGKLAAPAAPMAPYPYYGLHPFGFGFGVLGCIFPLLFFLLFFGLLRGIRGAWRGQWGDGMHRGHWGDGLPPKFEEWHKRAHGPAKE